MSELEASFAASGAEGFSGEVDNVWLLEYIRQALRERRNHSRMMLSRFRSIKVACKLLVATAKLDKLPLQCQECCITESSKDIATCRENSLASLS